MTESYEKNKLAIAKLEKEFFESIVNCYEKFIYKDNNDDCKNHIVASIKILPHILCLIIGAGAIHSSKPVDMFNELLGEAFDRAFTIFRHRLKTMGEVIND